MMTLKGSLKEDYSPQGAEDAEVTFLLFSFERKENNNHKPHGIQPF